MSYFIDRWDVIIEDGQKKPVIYVKPDAKLIDFWEKEDQVSVYLRGTKSPYEKKVAYARIVTPSCLVNYRPNTGKGMMCVIIESPWSGYPIGDYGIVDILEMERRPTVYPPRTENYVFIWLLLALLLLLIFLLNRNS